MNLPQATNLRECNTIMHLNKKNLNSSLKKDISCYNRMGLECPKNHAYISLNRRINPNSVFSRSGYTVTEFYNIT